MSVAIVFENGFRQYNGRLTDCPVGSAGRNIQGCPLKVTASDCGLLIQADNQKPACLRKTQSRPAWRPIRCAGSVPPLQEGEVSLPATSVPLENPERPQPA